MIEFPLRGSARGSLIDSPPIAEPPKSRALIGSASRLCKCKAYTAGSKSRLCKRCLQSLCKASDFGGVAKPLLVASRD